MGEIVKKKNIKIETFLYYCLNLQTLTTRIPR